MYGIVILGDSGDIISMSFEPKTTATRPHEDVFHQACEYIRSYAWRSEYLLIAVCGDWVIVDGDNPNGGILAVMSLLPHHGAAVDGALTGR